MAAADEAPPRMMKRLPQEEVSWILARDRVRSGNPEFEALEDELEELQTWVRAEYGSKGFVEVDHTFVGGRVRLQKKIAEYWEKHIAIWDANAQGNYYLQPRQLLPPTAGLKAALESRSRPL